MTNLKYIIAFVAGAGVGSLVTWKLVKDKYEQRAQEEIDSVKEVFGRKTKALDKEVELCKQSREKVVAEAREKPDITEYVSKLKECGYGHVDYTNIPKNDDDEEDPNDVTDEVPFMRPDEPADDEEDDQKAYNTPVVISPDSLGEIGEYRVVELTYYNDKALADENDELVEDVEGMVGYDALERFGEYEDDAVHVRNDRLKCYFEILKDRRQYSNVVGKRPHEVR